MARVTFILGCTGSGKSELAMALAERIGAEIISVDSMQIYRRMDIGTAKPDAADRARISHHLIDIIEPWESFSVAQFVACAWEAIRAIESRGRPILAVGGTALYIKALSEGLFEGPGAHPDIRERLVTEARSQGNDSLYERLRQRDPVTASRVHRNDLRRIIRALEVFEITGRPISELQTQWNDEHPPPESRFIGLRRNLADQNHRTNLRVRAMLKAGLIEETRALLALERPLSRTARQALGYAEVIEYLEGRLRLDEIEEKIKINTRQFAKAQRTWFRRFRHTHWVDVEAEAHMSDVADELVRMFFTG